MSRLPRLHSSPDRGNKQNQNDCHFPTMSTSNLKRKADDDDDELTDQPRKLPAIGTNKLPLREIRTRANGTGAGIGIGPPPLTKPRAPELSKSTTLSRMARATSAPPKSSARSVSSSSRRPIGGAGRVPSGSSGAGDNPDHFKSLQSQLLSLESARRADAAALATTLSSERAKVSELQSNHLALSRELAAAKEREREKEREDAEEVRKRHEREVKELEGEAKKWEREARQLEGEVRVLKGDLEHERSTVTTLKETLSTQTSSHLTLTTQNTLLTAQITALRSSLSSDATNISGLRDELERARDRVKELEEEAREAEGVRRGLHNLVMELKGNIRVFCRVRPVLPSDVPSPSPSASSEPSGGNLEGEGGVEVAEMKFPDRRDHKEIVLESVGESAMGQERREVYNFGFDRVRRFALLLHSFTPPPRYTVYHTNKPSTRNRSSSRTRPSPISSPRFPSSRRAARTGTMCVYSHMGRQGAGRASRWKVEE